MAWIFVFAAGLFEIGWAYAMKESAGFTRLWPTVATLSGMLASFALLSLAMTSLPLGTAYAVWTGIGAIGAFILGITLLGESTDPVRLVAAVLIVGGLVLMKLASPE